MRERRRRESDDAAPRPRHHAAAPNSDAHAGGDARAPLTGGTLLALSDGKTAVASNPDRDQVSFVDLTTNTVRATTMLMPGDEPGRLVEDGAGRVHVALRRGGAVATLDAKTGASSRGAASAPPRAASRTRRRRPDPRRLRRRRARLAAARGRRRDAHGRPRPRPARRRTFDKDGTLLVSTFRKAEVLVVGTDGKVALAPLQPASGRCRRPSAGHLRTGRPPSRGAWSRTHDDRQRPHAPPDRRDDAIDPAAGGYGGVEGCGGIVHPARDRLTPGSD